MSGITGGALARLAFWAKGMVSINDARMEWPGFSYSEAEWARMRALSEPIGAGTYQLFTIVNAVIFIVIAAIGIFGVFLPLATVLFPVPAETSALKFSLLLAACAFLIIGLGLPISMRLSAMLVGGKTVREALVSRAGDEALSSKVSWQINRIMLIMCGLLVPGILLFIAYDIQAGPIVMALKWLAIALMAVSTATGIARQRKS
ncbi:hypothetical protein EN829_013805 [Mesorhizobium sp. M00.F.Ca.ET.186.01.1.1]|nr:hypothetical protein EN848_15620 [bacterium M00.F.Ca.ET.205.01.1.1]TGU52768.1 hypothetical protein EN795_13775 [bacterium M00.F.Ca.ET.152.01.1.1]TGV35743.1 hypothetical protein EN829_013805 [Mesorhizobium sp. M00.F.Ca.ET.186.01.1.1]TGZ43320.1 hypothetical protein EN805_09385 [bacterium M00.F.Ca.ET.162.01.1.1]TIW62108.1 MAG: hypothetical protein E5V48_06065 [Mesorhizobium sp.]